MASKTITAPSIGDLDTLAASWARELRAANLSPRTVQSYGEAVRLFGEYLTAHAVRGGTAEKSAQDLTQGIYQVMMLLAPFLRDAERLHVHTLAQAYVK